MGSALSKALTGCEGVVRRLSTRRVHLLLTGLDCAGKTSLLRTIHGKAPDRTMPIPGMRVEQIQHENVEFSSWDLGGSEKIWIVYCEEFGCIGFHGIIFMVDSNDKARLPEAQDDLHRLLRQEGLRGLPLLVLANKQDLPYALDASAVAEGLGMRHMRTRPWHVQACCATNGTGLREGLEWLSRAVAAQRQAPMAAGSTAGRVTVATQVE